MRQIFLNYAAYTISISSEISIQLSENSSQEVPSSPTLKRAKNSFSDLHSPFYSEAEDNRTYQVSIDHEWEEAPVDIAVPKVTVKRIRKPDPPLTCISTKHQVRLLGCMVNYILFCIGKHFSIFTITSWSRANKNGTNLYVFLYSLVSRTYRSPLTSVMLILAQPMPCSIFYLMKNKTFTVFVYISCKSH